VLPTQLASWRIAAVAFVLVAALVSAISFAIASDDTRPPRPSAKQVAQERRPETSPEQAAILDDGVVTRAEYESAVNATIACLAGQRFKVSTPVEKDGRLDFHFATAVLDEGARYRGAYRDCHVQHQRDVDPVWAATLAENATPPAADLLAASRAAIAECRVREGVPGVAPDAPFQDMIDAAAKAEKQPNLFYLCVSDGIKKYGVVPSE